MTLPYAPVAAIRRAMARGTIAELCKTHRVSPGLVVLACLPEQHVLDTQRRRERDYLFVLVDWDELQDEI